MNITSRFAVSLASVIALAAFACSSAQPDTGLSDSKPTGSKTPAPAKDDDSKATDTSPSEPTQPLDDSKACGSKATAQECGECCLAKKPTAFDAADQIFFDCICAATACATACSDSVCATADNDNEPNAACKTCLDAQEPACDTKAGAACDADADCKAAEACLASSCDPIAEKEEKAGGGNGGGKLATARSTKQLNARAAKATYRQR